MERGVYAASASRIPCDDPEGAERGGSSDSEAA